MFYESNDKPEPSKEQAIHSPAPWHRDYAEIFDADGQHVVWELGNYNDSDASLIVAAPELLAASRSAILLIEAWMNGLLREVGIQWESPEHHPPALRALRAAVERAEGR